MDFAWPHTSITAAPAGSESSRLSALLYEMLLKPVERSIEGSQSLIIVPDGVLYYVPFEALQAAGTTSLRGIAAELNNRGIQTPRGKGEWQAGTVSQLLARLIP